MSSLIASLTVKRELLNLQMSLSLKGYIQKNCAVKKTMFLIMFVRFTAEKMAVL